MRRRIAVLITGLLLVLGIAGSAAPAAATPTTENGTQAYIRARIESYQTGRCLDSNNLGQVYTLPCTADNNFQRWDIWDGGWTKNVATGRCLYIVWVTGGGPQFPRMHTGACHEQPSHLWHHWNGGWYQNVQRGPAGDYICFASYKPWWEAGSEDMTTNNIETCADKRAQFWGQRSY